jgi:hypothetical protein
LGYVVAVSLRITLTRPNARAFDELGCGARYGEVTEICDILPKVDVRSGVIARVIWRITNRFTVTKSSAGCRTLRRYRSIDDGGDAR